MKNKLERYEYNKKSSFIIQEGKSLFDKTKGKWSNIFNNNNPIYLELGCGNGEYTISNSSVHPNFNFIGIEVYDSGIGNALKQISDNEINNIKILKIDAVLFLKNFIKTSSLYGVSLFFPDPWPKKKHYKRRIINEDFLNLISDRVRKGGFVKIATDWTSYNESITELFETNKKFSKVSDIPIYNERILTKFERRGILLGHNIFDSTFKVN